MIRRLSLVLLLVAARPVLAQDLSAARPADCQPHFTLHYSQCTSMTLLTCNAGAYLRVESSTDGQLESILLQTPDYRRIAEGIEGNAMMTGLVEQSRPLPIMDLGPDIPLLDHEIHMMMNFMGIQRPASFVGTATFAGTITLPSGDVIDEVRLDLVQNLPPPMPPIPGGGSYYLDRVTGYAIEGFITFDFPGEEDHVLPSLLDVVHSGEAGFDQKTPAGGCDMISVLPPDNQKVRA